MCLNFNKNKVNSKNDKFDFVKCLYNIELKWFE